MTIGQSVPRRDAWEKVTGRAKFAADLSMEGALHMKLVYSGRPHARILSIDASLARSQPSVVAVFTSDDVPVNRYGLETPDQPVLCAEVVRFVGDPLAAVVAETHEQAATAAQSISIKYQDLPGIFSPQAALSPEAPRIHETLPDNILHTIRVRRGVVADAFAAADVIVEHTYETPMQEHAFLEPEAGLAYPDQNGTVTIIAAGQSVHDDQRQIAAALTLPLDQVRVRYGAIGGAFGGREDISVQILLALAAWKLDKPVKIVWSRAESIRGHVKRHAAILQHKWGARADGKITAAQVDIILDAGAYAATSQSVLEGLHAMALGPYDIPNVSIDGRAVLTNNLPGGAFRGFGSPQAAFAAELQVARLADLLKIDPVSMRLKNCLQEDSLLPTQSPATGSDTLAVMIKTCAQEAGWTHDDRGWRPLARKAPQFKQRGFGLALGLKNIGFGYGFPEGSEPRVILHGDAHIEEAELHTAAADNGQGSHAALQQICAAALDLPIEKVVLVTSDTAVIGDSGPASASRLTAFAGNAVKLAAEAALARWSDEDRPAVGHIRWDAPRTTTPDPETGASIAYISHSFGVQAVEVEVDLDTGAIELLQVTAVHDPGRAINPQQVAGQIEGAVIQALGWSLTENFITNNGEVLTDQLSTYLIPTVSDIPKSINCVLLETPDPVGPFGVRGVGEIPFIPLAPAIAAAIQDAVGIWIDRLPIRAEDVFYGLSNQENT